MGRGSVKIRLTNLQFLMHMWQHACNAGTRGSVAAMSGATGDWRCWSFGNAIVHENFRGSPSKLV
jgi:hypothetical protein